MRFNSNPNSSSNSRHSSNSSLRFILSKGFTLVETIIGIVVLSIAFSIMTTLIFPLMEDSADQLHQIRAAELGQSMLNEIQARAFDENSDRNGGFVRCGETGADACTANDKLGPDTVSGVLESRNSFNDVDDYDGLVLAEDALGNDLSDIYTNFTVAVSVCNDGDYDGICSANTATSADMFTAKLITVTITTPSGLAIDFSTYRANF